jgi:hypothetical protein
VSGADARVAIVGSGPAGVSAAWPFVRAGVPVVMLDAAEHEGAPSPLAASPSAFRSDPDRWRAQFGAGLAGLGPGADCSPKFTTPLARSVLAGYTEALGLETRGFFAAGALARGGLSTIWGALAAEWTREEFAGFPFDPTEIQSHYDSVRARIGAPRPGPESLTSPAARHMWDHLSRHPQDFWAAPAPNAVLDAPMDGRQACIRCGLCLWGCSRRSIYDSGDEVAVLRRHPGFDYRPGHRVVGLGRDGALHVLDIEARGARLSLRVEVVLLAAGALSTAALALPRLGLDGRPTRLLSNPAAATAFVVPRLIGADLPDESVSLGQLFYRLPVPGSDMPAAGVLYGADALPLATIADRLPVSRPTALRLARALAPALVLATAYLPGRYSRNRITVGKGRVLIEGEQTAEAATALRGVLRRLSRALGPAALPLPWATSLLEPGADAHYAGVLPMGGEAPFACSDLGELAGAPGLHVVDGAALSTLPATHPTLTIMANAARIGEAVARKMGARV